MQLFIAIEPGDEQHAFGVVVPDLPGCFSAGDTLEQTISNAKEAIRFHWELLLEDDPGFQVTATPLEALQRQAAFQGFTWVCIEVEPPR